MNEGVISSYEHLIGGSGLPSDLAIEMAAATSIHAPIGTDYHKEIIPQPTQQQHSRSFHHPSTYNNLIGAVCDGTTQNIVPAQMSFTCNNNNNSATYIGNGASNTAFTQIPFVQIHTTDVQPQSAFNSTRFRRNLTSNNQEEIKAEPIKSENSESAKERINGTPTPPVPVQQRSESQASKNFTQNEKVVYSDLETTRGPSDEVNEKTTKTCTKRGTSFTFPDIFKCQHCAFVSLTERSLQLHLNSNFQGTSTICENAISRTKLPCPGCDNVFYAYSVVETHLREDHLMSEEDISELMQTIKRNNQPSEQSNTVSNVKTSDIEVSNDASIKGTQRRSRIYLKNVECLREPNRDPIEQQDNLINDSLFHFENDECNALENIGSISMEEQDLIGMLTNGEPLFHNKSDNNIDNIVNETIAATVETNKTVNPPKQKISIKSVDVLREPALARRDYELQSFGDFISVCNDLNLHVPNNSNNNNNESNCDNSHSRINDTDGQYSYSVPPNREPLVGNNGVASIAEFTNELEKPRRPKIYIKNVDILKEPMTFSNNVNAPSITDSTNNVMNFNFMQPTIPQTVNSYLDTVDSLNATVPPFNGGMSQLPLGTISDQYLFDSGGGNFLVNNTTTVSDNYTYGNEQTAENFLMDSNRFADAITPMTTEPTPSPPTMSTTVSHNNNCMTDAQLTQNATAITNVQKQKIFIKNVDILKEPQFQEPRGLLHLRTVDELNLMNRKDVENLIAPNLEGNQANLVEEELSDNFARSNNANGESLSAIDNCNASNLIEAISYGCEGFKLNEFSTQNGWHDDYDLGDDIREIITSTMAPTLPSAQKTIHDLDTPQISLISIPDMEELTGTSAELNVSSESVTNVDHTMTSTVTQQQTSTNFTFECEIPSTENISLEEPVCSSENLVNTTAIGNEVMPEPQTEPESIDTALLESTELLKQERLNQATPGEHTDPAPTQKNKANNFDDIPPLTPMTSATYAVSTNLNTSTTIVAPTGLPVPPLVPMLPPKAIALTNVNTPANSTERGRIYVANNLMQAPNAASMAQTPKAQAPTKSHSTKNLDKQQTKTPIAVSVTGGTSVRGRPFGSNRTGVTKLRKQPLNENGAGVYLKCTVTGCAFRFKKSSTLDYHIKCHSSESPPQSMACPECKAPFTNWNSLHTHLWRTHKIDMELYSCELCSFKTPIYSRLLNTHSKIHYDERNYKCDQCEKAFKNTKQLKNHRRWHRNHNKTTTSPSAKREVSKKADASASESNGPTLLPPTTTSASTSDATQVPVTAARHFYRCKDCEAVFSHQKTLREHLCKNAAAAIQCEVCDRVLTSRSSIKLHMQTHESSRRFKCNVCDYSGSDHNAFRRHKMTHDNNAKMYACAHCDYKSIQSVAYQKHVQQKHPQVADSIVYKCKMCTYATINKGLFDLHQVKHEKKNGNIEATAALPGENAGCAEKTTTVKTKIKVKSHLLLTTSTDSIMESNELCFDAVTMTS
ncbi:probable serine/threonine-protein kinase ndrD [Bactrocera dorsalis]|uniref:Probable serine/threonine-protein kinase ndrD n=1 Tax=Bactrocera dorsalis TaxID=27457 RepID=A0A6I9VLL8_BACDO|nr:probable serine/threonine-protein kinase ndrD [Bactrocera dorsalis]